MGLRVQNLGSVIYKYICIDIRMLRNKESAQLIIINKTMKHCHGRKATTKLKKKNST